MDVETVPISESFKTICEIWEKAGLDFRTTIIAFPVPPHATPEERRAYEAMKALARKEIECSQT